MPVIKIPLLSFATLYGFSGVSESYVITPLKGHHPVLCTCFVSSQNASRHIPWCSRGAPPGTWAVIYASSTFWDPT